MIYLIMLWDYLVEGGYILINNSIVEEFKELHPIANKIRKSKN